MGGRGSNSSRVQAEMERGVARAAYHRDVEGILGRRLTNGERRVADVELGNGATAETVARHFADMDAAQRERNAARAAEGRGSRLAERSGGDIPAMVAVIERRDEMLRSGRPQNGGAIARGVERRLTQIADGARVGTRVRIGRQTQLNDEVLVKREDGWHYVNGRGLARYNSKRAYSGYEFARIASSASRIEEG